MNIYMNGSENIAFYMVLVTALLHIVPESGYQKVYPVLYRAGADPDVLTPVLKLFGMEGQLRDLYQSQEYMKEIEQMEVGFWIARKKQKQ